MSHSGVHEKTVQPTIVYPTNNISQNKHEDYDGENPEISSAIVDLANDRLVRLSNEHGVCRLPRWMRILLTPQATWASPTDSSDPYNWKPSRKFVIGTIFSFGQLIPIMSASMIAPSLPAIASDLAISASTAQITMSVYFLGMAFAPFLIASASEVWGRKPVWIVCNAWYVVWNALCPVGRNTGLMIVGRFMAGAGASVGVTVSDKGDEIQHEDS